MVLGYRVQTFHLILKGPLVSTKLAVIHTSPSLVPIFQTLCTTWLPGVNVFHMVDESLIRNTVEAGRLEKVTMRRVIAMVDSAGLAGADAVLVTCSSIGAAVTTAAGLFDFPVIRVDDAMAEKAVTLGSRVGVLATLRTTLEPTTELVRSKGTGGELTVVDRLVDGAFDAVMAGDGATHDALVGADLKELMGQVDVVVLAQASMARVLAGMRAEELTVPVLSSPELAVRRVADVLQARG
jgi:Asp/Glu/hydantoin racemase